MPEPITLTEPQRARLAALADHLLPATAELPAPSALQIEGRWIDRVLAARVDLGGPLVATLDATGDGPAGDAIARLSAIDPEAAELLLLVTSAAYYAHPKVRRRLGYPGQTADLPRPDEAEHFLRGGLLEPVERRGRIYRDVVE